MSSILRRMVEPGQCRFKNMYILPIASDVGSIFELALDYY